MSLNMTRNTNEITLLRNLNSNNNNKDNNENFFVDDAEINHNKASKQSYRLK